MAIYFDNSATSYPKPENVYLAVDGFLRNNGANPGRGNHARALQAKRLLYDTRKSLAKLFGIHKTARHERPCRFCKYSSGCLKPTAAPVASPLAWLLPLR